MKEEEKGTELIDFSKNMPPQTEEIGFRPEELVFCRKCSRTNPPTRLKCFYCNAELEVSARREGKIAPVLRKLENWENGFNLILFRAEESLSNEVVSEIAQIVRLEKDVLQRIFAAQKQLPLARAESSKEAEIVQQRLRAHGVETLTLADLSLDAGNAPRRLRGLEFDDRIFRLILFNTDEVIEIPTESLCLLVTGAIFQKEVESTEKRKKGESRIVETSETASDEFLLDFYDRNDSRGYRISVKGFDFSCLEAEKGILARENIQKLTAKLQKVAPKAKLVDDYFSLRDILGRVWEIERRKDSRGIKRQGFGRFDLANTYSSNNLQQFTKYSRLQRQIL